MRSEGRRIKHSNGVDYEYCKNLCDESFDEGCRSFGYCPDYKGGSCYLFDKELNGTEDLTTRTDCYTNYRMCNGNSYKNISINLTKFSF